MHRSLPKWCLVTIFAYQLCEVQPFGQQIDTTLTALNQSTLTDKSVVDISKLIIRKFNRTHQIVKGDVEVFRDIDNSLLIAADVYKKQGNEWRLAPYRLLFTPFCDYWKNEIYISDDVIRHSELPPKTECPAIPKGKYRLNDFPVGGANIPTVLAGELRCKVKFQDGGELVTTLTADIDFQLYG